ncbi:MAG: quinol oxidase [Steroidobacteraceae bacterium]|nr:quinol oxidase [Deltaproteobacteria bacterium]
MKTLLTFLLIVMTAFCSMAAEPPTIVEIDKDGVQRVEMLGSEYFFKPGHIVVKINVPVEIKVRKDALIVPHDFVISAPEAGISINESLSRDPKTFFFTPGKVGKYPIYCSKKVPFMKSHREKGMEALLEVVE